jgi:hypothetical protein
MDKILGVFVLFRRLKNFSFKGGWQVSGILDSFRGCIVLYGEIVNLKLF